MIRVSPASAILGHSPLVVPLAIFIATSAGLEKTNRPLVADRCTTADPHLPFMTRAFPLMLASVVMALRHL